MNRKGFAITTVIYGLTVLGLMIMSILMGLLSSTRNNVASEAERVEKELIAFNQATQSFTCKGTTYTHTVPEGESGWYRIEAFGNGSATAKGAYTTGIIYLQQGKQLTICDGYNGVVKANSSIIMKPASGLGGTLKGYSKEASMPSFGIMNFKLDTGKNITGSEGISHTGGNASQIRGYPGGTNNSTSDYFVDGYMLPTVNESTYGRVTIQKLAGDEENDITTQANRIPGRNKKYDNIKSIEVTLRDDDVSLSSIYATSKGNVYSNTSCSSTSCTLTFSSGTNIDDVSVLFTTGSYNKHIGGSSSSYVLINFKKADAGATSTNIYNSQSTSTMNNATPTGIKLSAYQPDYISAELPKHGNYYIFPITTESRALSARESVEGESNPITAEYFKGETRQKWAIDLIASRDNSYKLFSNINNTSGSAEYRIMELTRYKSIAIYQDENIRRNVIAAPETFQSLSRNEPQIWNIIKMNDGTYAIKTVVIPSNPLARSGFLAADTNATGTEDNPVRIMIGTINNVGTEEYNLARPTEIERFKLYSIDFVKY